MTEYLGEGLIKCHDCAAMVPSIESLIDLPGAPEHMTACFRPVMDATMHNPGCNYCHSPEVMEYLRPFMEQFKQDDQARNKLTVGELLDSIDGILNPNITAEELMKVAEIGKLLFYEAIFTADEEDNAEFFAEAYGFWGPVVDAVLQECGRDYRNSQTGQAGGSR
jgi:hypothetical protein